MKPKLVHALSTLLGLGLFIASLLILHHELHVYHSHEIMRHIAAPPHQRLMLALGLTFLSYLALTGYEYLAFRYIKQPLSFGKIAGTSLAVTREVGCEFISRGSSHWKYV